MASGYKIDGVDLDDLCEPYVASSAVNSNNQDLSTFSVNGTPMTNRYQKANTDSWASVIELPLQRDGVAVKTVAKGCFPTQTKFAEITSAGTFLIWRTDESLTIGSTTYPASHFRNGVVPKMIGVIIAGAGGGGGGWGAAEGDKNGFNRIPSGAGGGGAVGAYVMSVDNSRSGEIPFLYKVTIGAGGAGGSWGSGEEGSRPSSGSSGSAGGNSQILVQTTKYWTEDSASAVVTASGGSGGSGGNHNSSNTASGGAGGGITHQESIMAPFYKLFKWGGSGGTYTWGDVGSSTGGGATSIEGFSFTTDAGVSLSTIFYNASGGYYYSTNDNYRGCWQSGGASFGNGGTNSTSATKGGGGCSNSNSNGADGYCAFYY